ncbi:hypothetical protein WA588_004571 [Blastocystis sp. NMH]
METVSRDDARYTAIPHEINTRYLIKKELGKGAYGTVYLAVDRKTGEQVAIKRIEDVFRSRVDAKRTLREITILRQCNHPNISKLLDILVPPDPYSFRCLWTIQEYGGWDLSRIVRNSQRIAGWGPNHVKFIIYQLLCGLLYMQSAHIVHRDLKPSNILINSKCELKIIDFGLARQMNLQYQEEKETKSDVARAGVWGDRPSSVERQLTQHVVTRWYRAPELILLQQYYNAEIDIWSVGCILAELLQTLEPNRRVQPLFPGSSCFPLSSKRNEKQQNERFGEEFRAETHQLMKIFEVIGTPSHDDVMQLDDGPMKEFLLSLEFMPPMDFKQLYPHAEPASLELLRRMLAFNPEKRITVEEALQSAFVAPVRREENERICTETMVFPFEYGVQGSPENERQILRRLIYNEALLFNKEEQQQERVPRVVGRHRSQTMGAIPERYHSQIEPSFRDRTMDPFYSEEDKNNCCIL